MDPCHDICSIVCMAMVEVHYLPTRGLVNKTRQHLAKVSPATLSRLVLLLVRNWPHAVAMNHSILALTTSTHVPARSQHLLIAGGLSRQCVGKDLGARGSIPAGLRTVIAMI